MEAEVHRGEIAVKCLWMVTERPDIYIIEGSLSSKYAEIEGYTFAARSALIMLGKGVYTIGLDDNRANIPTYIELTLPNGEDWADWRVVADITKYHFTAAIYRDRQHAGTDFLWESPI